ncbi:hemolymph lipopolysaccharide-binding protein-like [Zootermopsis nevadensis]|uniref:Hemolymph lipopolysaccharide-binding protein n=1 Tax=Zootermopsis nevadensis TaxID=136037 RepID=A0A067QRS3_ZOONE|nr:hemolymph lipopolysaccharide-binding protein-like [Zootermopsis nevadensis]KDR12220.1 Hemolymph lipopolysaccharide-binding protein [Zootermopsis nevadensis]
MATAYIQGLASISTTGSQRHGPRPGSSDDGAHLVVINSEAEAQLIRQLLTGVNPQHYVYVGFHKHYNNNVFLTIEGKRLEHSGYYKWSPGKPSNDPNHKCGAVFPSALLTNKDCTGQWYFICEHQLKCRHDTMVSVFHNWD